MLRDHSQSLSLVRAGLTGLAIGGFQSGEDLFEVLATHTPVGIFVSSAEGGCVYVNERWCELTGLTPEQAMGDGWAVALHPDDAERVNREWAEAAVAGRDSVVEYRFVRPDGAVSWIEGYAATLRDRGGRVVGWVGTCLDYTARKEAEEARQRAAERFRVAFGNAPIGMALVTPEGHWIDVNPALCDLLGYSEEELLRLSVTDVTHPDDRATTLNRRQRRLAGHVFPSRIEKRYVRADGGIVRVAVSSTVVRDSSGRPLYSVSQIEDVTERVRAQEALAEAEERFRRAFDDAPIGMAIVGLDGRWLRVNARLCEITGYDEDELLARRFVDVTHPEDVDKNAENIDNLSAGRVRSIRIEKRYVRPSGEIVWVNISSSLIVDADGKPLHLVSQIEDVTERRRADARLQEMADHDPLTGLLNRRRFEEERARAVGRLGRHGGEAALCLVDLDRFKEVNDTFGHKTGDDVLIAVASALKSRLRATDVVARLGGDEFAVLLLDVDAERAESVADELVSAVRGLRITSGPHELSVTASAGLVLFGSGRAVGDEEALVAVDRALYRAKHEGRDRIAFGS